MHTSGFKRGPGKPPNQPKPMTASQIKRKGLRQPEVSVPGYTLRPLECYASKKSESFAFEVIWDGGPGGAGVPPYIGMICQDKQTGRWATSWNIYLERSKAGAEKFRFTTAQDAVQHLQETYLKNKEPPRA